MAVSGYIEQREDGQDETGQGMSEVNKAVLYRRPGLRAHTSPELLISCGGSGEQPPKSKSHEGGMWRRRRWRRGVVIAGKAVNVLSASGERWLMTGDSISGVLTSLFVGS